MQTEATLFLYKLDFSAKMNKVSEHSYSEFYYLKKKKKKKEEEEEKTEKRGGHVIKCLLTELGRAGQENIWHSVMAHRLCCARAIFHSLGPNICLAGPPTKSISP